MLATVDAGTVCLAGYQESAGIEVLGAKGSDWRRHL
jgi:hypothetical protein